MVKFRRTKQLQTQKNELKELGELKFLVFYVIISMNISASLWVVLAKLLEISQAFMKTAEQERMHFKTDRNGNKATANLLRAGQLSHLLLENMCLSSGN